MTIHTTNIPLPTLHDTRRLTLVEWYVSTKPDAYRKGHGLYLTPVAVADFMAELVASISDEHAPCAAIALLAHEQSPESVAVWIKPTVLENLKEWCDAVQVRQADFVMAMLAHSSA